MLLRGILRVLRILWILWILLHSPYLLAEHVQFAQNRPFTESKNAEHNDIGDGNEHQQAKCTAVTRLREDFPVNDNREGDQSQGNDAVNNAEGCDHCLDLTCLTIRHLFLLYTCNPAIYLHPPFQVHLNSS